MGRILIIDDDSNARELLRRHLTKAGHEVAEAENEEMALEEVKIHLPDVVLLDVMSDMTGFELCQRLRSIPQNNLIYIIMLTDAAWSEGKPEGLRVDADDYVSKPFDMEELLARIQVGVRTVKKKRGIVTDGLSGLFNRDFFNLYLVQEVERVQRYKRELSLIALDIDHFKTINATYGPLIGDLVLEEISKILKMHCRLTDILVRWGGEKFIILLPETNLTGAVILAERIRQAIDTYHFEDVPHVAASFGVACFKTDEQDLILRADAALYRAKKKGENRVEVSE